MPLDCCKGLAVCVSILCNGEVSDPKGASLVDKRVDVRKESVSGARDSKEPFDEC